MAWQEDHSVTVNCPAARPSLILGLKAVLARAVKECPLLARHRALRPEQGMPGIRPTVPSTDAVCYVRSTSRADGRQQRRNLRSRSKAGLWSDTACGRFQVRSWLIGAAGSARSLAEDILNCRRPHGVIHRSELLSHPVDHHRSAATIAGYVNRDMDRQRRRNCGSTSTSLPDASSAAAR